MKFKEAVEKAKDIDCEHAVPVLQDWHRSKPDDPGTVACLAKASRYEDDIECDHMDNYKECSSWHARILPLAVVLVVAAIIVLCAITNM